ncbi:MAG: hypothetical protein ACYS0D_11695, partial [Planctomycetota bacterium]
TRIVRTIWDLPLWDLLRAPVAPRQRTGGIHERYSALVREMKQRYGIRIHKWRRSTSGCAWVVRYANGTESRLIEAPYPRGPVSCAVFLHEIGHHAIGFGVYSPRCLEEYHAWDWALQTMRAHDLNVTEAVQRRMDEAVRHALRKARRRGLRRVPSELVAYI